VSTYRQYDDGKLLHLIYQDDEFAFTEIYNRYWKKLFAISYSRLQETQLAEDIVHDVFTSLWANRQKIQVESVPNYLATATKYLVLDKIKKRERERIYNDYTTKSSQTPIAELPVETSLHYKRILEIVKLEIDNLPEKCRLIFNFSRNEGMPVKQIAKELNISPKTVENQLYKAVKQLKLVSKSFLHFFL
jgi:RNA polymerase sigma-70 factor (ECF subfamily)